jgi:hypothetical protein
MRNLGLRKTIMHGWLKMNSRQRSLHRSACACVIANAPLCREDNSDAGQHEQSRQRQTEQQERQNHKNNADGFEMKALSNRRD